MYNYSQPTLEILILETEGNFATSQIESIIDDPEEHDV